MFALLLALLAPTASASLGAAPLARANSEAAALSSIRVSLNGGDYTPGDEVRVKVEPGSDGYLVVFRVDGDGRVRVLFPLDPDVDAYVRGGRRYEIRGRGERSTFLADDIDGTGLIYAALSRAPMVFNDYAANNQWDYGMLRLRSDDDPEAELSSMVRRMTANERVDYDIVGYRVHGTRTYASGGYGGYDPYYDCLACGYPIGSGVNIRVGSGYGRYDRYDPWLYGDAGYGYYRYGSPYSYGYPYGYGYGYGYGNRGYDPYRPVVVYPTRPRPVATLAPYGYRSRSPQGLAGAPASFAPDLGGSVRPSPRTTPTESYDGRSRVRNTTSDASRPTSTSGRTGRAEAPSRETPVTREPQREPQRQPQPSARPSTPAPSSGGEGRSRKPNNSGDEERAVTLPSVDRQATGQRTIFSDGRPIFREVPPATRRGEPETRRPDEPARDRPVYREPPRPETRAEPQRPVRSAPRDTPRAETPARSAPAREAPRPAPSPQREAPRTESPVSQPRAERPAPQPQPSSPAPEPASRSRRPNN
ncbi:MAG: DUF4384 domain-containing protein [Gemmatimonadales bacterium]